MWEPTELQTYTECPNKWYLRQKGFEEGIRRLGTVRGTFGHRILYHGMEFADELWYMLLQQSAQPIRATEEETTKAYNETLEMCGNFLRMVDELGIVFVEKERSLIWEYNRGRNQRGAPTVHYFRGTIDALVRFPDTPEGEVEAIDYKFGRIEPVEARLRNIQAGSYYYGLRANNYKVNRFMFVGMQDFLAYRRNQQKVLIGGLRGPFFYPVKITDEDLPYIASQVGKIISNANAALHFQAPYGIGNTPCSYCDYKWTHCRRYANDISEEEVILV